jgi:hypothetical protein
MKFSKIAFVGLALGLATIAPAWGQATRTWVSGVGDDANPCSRTAPCKTFAGAISKTAAGGEINTLDPGGFGGVTITKSITIAQEGTGTAGVLVSGTNGIIINAGVNDVIVLRGLDFEGLGTGLNGIRMLAGKQLFVENCTINAFRAASAGFGIDINSTTAGVEVFIKDTTIRNNGTGSTGGGMIIRPTAGSVRASLENVRFENNVFGLKTQDNTTTTVKDSVAAGNTNAGYSATSAAALALLTVVDSIAASNNGVNGSGVEANGAMAAARIGGMTITGNTTGLLRTGGGQIISFTTNNVSGNGTDGTPSSTAPPI